MSDVPDAWHNGGWVCSACGEPVETVPCEQHQPTAWQDQFMDDPHDSLHPWWHEGCPDCVERANWKEAQR